MDESLRTAARKGNVSDLYTLIQRNGNVLRRLDEVEFIDTPLHIAAEAGCMQFAMEVINLKPPFARKLNQQGLSPIHLAVEKGHKEMVLRLLEIDNDLVRVKGRNGETPLHYISKVGNRDGLLDKFLEACPECIRDVTIHNRTALHIAVENKRLDVLRILIETLKKKDYYRKVVNRKDEDGNTALHLAASNNQLQMLKLLLNCKADKHATNQDGLTALDVAQRHNNRECIDILHGCSIPVLSNLKSKLEKQIIKYATKASSSIFHNMDDISSDDRNALLVILALLLTATYQAALSPPGGVWQGDNTSKSNGSYDEAVLGTSVLNEMLFFIFYLPTYVVFIVTFFLTLALLKPFPHGFRTALQVLLAVFAICFDLSVKYIAPSTLAHRVMTVFSVMVFILTVFMFRAYPMSKLSVGIFACWFSPAFLPLTFSVGDIVVENIVQGCWLFLFLHDEFREGTIILVVYSLSTTMPVILWAGVLNFTNCIAFGCWLFLSICRFCIKRFLIHRERLSLY
ncbi:hypothetical protein V6N13_121828 [Hibiscus sabdariffa]